MTLKLKLSRAAGATLTLIGCIEYVFMSPLVINSDLLLRSVDLSADKMQNFSGPLSREQVLTKNIPPGAMYVY